MRNRRLHLLITLLSLALLPLIASPTAAQPTAQLVFVKNAQLMLMNADGSDQKNLNNSEASDSQPSWSPDGERVVFASDRLAEGYELTLGSRSNLFVIGAEGGEPTTLTDGKEADTFPVYSPNGKQIALVRRMASFESQIMLISAEGGTAEVLAKSPDMNPIGALAWFPDGKALTFTVVSQMDSRVVGVYRVEIESKAVTPIATDGTTPVVAAGPAWSSVTNKAVFLRRDPSRDANGETGYAILTSNADGTDEALVLGLPTTIADGQTLRDAANFAWSPDGTMLAFDAPDPRFQRAAFRQILVMAADGSGVMLLTTDEQASAQTPQWRPVAP